MNKKGFAGIFSFFLFLLVIYVGYQLYKSEVSNSELFTDYCQDNGWDDYENSHIGAVVCVKFDRHPSGVGYTRELSGEFDKDDLRREGYLKDDE